MPRGVTGFEVWVLPRSVAGSDGRLQMRFGQSQKQVEGRVFRNRDTALLKFPGAAAIHCARNKESRTLLFQTLDRSLGRSMLISQ